MFRCQWRIRLSRFLQLLGILENVAVLNLGTMTAQKAKHTIEYHFAQVGKEKVMTWILDTQQLCHQLNIQPWHQGWFAVAFLNYSCIRTAYKESISYSILHIVGNGYIFLFHHTGKILIINNFGKHIYFQQKGNT